MDEDCEATIKVDTDNQSVVEVIGQHNCQASLQLKVDTNYAMLDEHVFWRDSGIYSITWYIISILTCGIRGSKKKANKVLPIHTYLDNGLILQVFIKVEQ